MSKQAKKQPQINNAEPIRRFVRAVAFPLKAGDHWKTYQIEEIMVQGDNIVSRQMLDKPDTKQMTLAKLELMTDPDSEENEAH